VGLLVRLRGDVDSNTSLLYSHILPPARCHTLHAEILSLLPVSMVTSWRGMGAGGASQKFLWLTEQQILRFGLEYRFDRHRPMPESQHQRFVDRIQQSFGKDFEGPVIALQPNFQQADFPLHTDQPALEGFGNKIITVGVYGDGWVVIRDKDGKKSFKFKVGTGDAWAMVGKVRWEWAHGVLCETWVFVGCLALLLPRDPDADILSLTVTRATWTIPNSSPTPTSLPNSRRVVCR